MDRNVMWSNPTASIDWVSRAHTVLLLELLERGTCGDWMELVVTGWSLWTVLSSFMLFVVSGYPPSWLNAARTLSTKSTSWTTKHLVWNIFFFVAGRGVVTGLN